MDYWYAFPEDRPGKAGIANAEFPPEVWYPLLDHILGGGVIDTWEEVEYSVIRGPFVDFQPDTSGLRLCSERLRVVVDAAASEADSLQWLPIWASVEDERRRYWVLHFPERFKAPQGHNVLAPPNGSAVSFLVSAEVKHAMETNGCTGAIFEPYP